MKHIAVDPLDNSMCLVIQNFTCHVFDLDQNLEIDKEFGSILTCSKLAPLLPCWLQCTTIISMRLQGVKMINAYLFMSIISILCYIFIKALEFENMFDSTLSRTLCIQMSNICHLWASIKFCTTQPVTMPPSMLTWLLMQRGFLY